MKKVLILLFVLLAVLPLLFCFYVPKVQATGPWTYSQTPDLSGDDGDCGHTDGGFEDYLLCRNAATSTSASNGTDNMYIGQNYVSAATTFYMRRAFVKFNTTTIPLSANITAAQLRFYVKQDTTTTDFTIRLQNWTGSTPIDGDDYNDFDGTSYDTGVSTSGISTVAYVNDTISNFSLITLGGSTQICIRSSKDISASEPTNSEVIFLYTFDSAYPPYLEINYTSNATPTIGAVSGTNWDDTDNLYAQKKSYTCSITYTDTDSYADIHYVELYFQSSANATRAQFQYHEDDNSVSTITGGTTWTLESAAGDFSRSGNNIVASWKFTGQWDATEESDLDFLFYVVDAAGASASSTSDQNFDVVTRLTTSGLASDDSQINKGGTTTISGTVYYANAPAGSTSSSSYPPNAEFTSVSIHDSAHSVATTHSTIVNGAFSVSFSIPDSVQSNTYHVYINMADADYADGDAADGDTTAVIGDALAIDNLQSVQYIGSGQYRYQAQIKWGYNSSVINGAAVNVSNPSGVSLSSLTSNSTGWVNFVIGQTNGTVGTFTIFGVNDNAGITVAGSNQTFALLNWNLVAQDHDGNTLSGTSVVVKSGTTSVWSGSPSNIFIPSASFSVTLSWYGFTVNTTSTIASQTGTDNFNCSAYPYVKDSTRYWVGTDATVSSVTFTSDLLVVKFSGSAATYSLVATCSQRPSYVLNCSYNYDVDWTTYLTLSHYGNTTISIAYYSWSDTYIQKVSLARMTAVAWVSDTLNMDFEGSTGDTGTVIINCGGRGSPAASTGWDTAIYSGGTKDFTCTMVFTSTISGSVSWTSLGHGGITGTTYIPSTTLIRADFSTAILKQGEKKQITASVIWTGPTIVYVYGLSFAKPDQAEWFTIDNLPIQLTRSDLQGEGSFPVTLTLPQNLKAGIYNIPCTLLMRTDTSQDFSSDAVISFTLAQAAVPPGPAPELLTVLFLVGFAVILLTFLRSPSSPIRRRK